MFDLFEMVSRQMRARYQFYGTSHPVLFEIHHYWKLYRLIPRLVLQFVFIETIMSCLADEFKIIERHRKIFLVVLCCIAYLLGLTCVTQVRNDNIRNKIDKKICNVLAANHELLIYSVSFSIYAKVYAYTICCIRQGTISPSFTAFINVFSPLRDRVAQI